MNMLEQTRMLLRAIALLRQAMGVTDGLIQATDDDRLRDAHDLMSAARCNLLDVLAMVGKEEAD